MSSTDANPIVSLLEQRGIRPSAQRVAIASFVLATAEHPAADTVWRTVRARFPMVSRATVYNTLNLFVDKGLLREVALAPGRVAYDPNTEPHHHFVDAETGAIEDLPWESLRVDQRADLSHLDIDEISVTVRGRRLQQSGRAAREDRRAVS